MMIHHQEGAVIERRVPGPSLYYTSCRPAAPRAWVAVVHGYAEHSARYAHVMDAWAEQGIGSVAIDLRGHGRAQGVRGHIEHWSDVVDDVRELESLVKARAEGAPTFLFGHSFGGLTAIASALADPAPWRGLVLSGPYLGLAVQVPAPKRFAGRIASRILPTFTLPTGIRGLDVTHDELRAREYDNDPLVFKTATARWFTEALAMQASAMSRASLLRLPLQLSIGTDDKLVRVDTARAFFSAVASTDKSWTEYPGLYHEILNEREWRPIADTMGRWMLERAG